MKKILLSISALTIVTASSLAAAQGVGAAVKADGQLAAPIPAAAPSVSSVAGSAGNAMERTTGAVTHQAGEAAQAATGTAQSTLGKTASAAHNAVPAADAQLNAGANAGIKADAKADPNAHQHAHGAKKDAAKDASKTAKKLHKKGTAETSKLSGSAKTGADAGLTQ